MLIEPLWWRLSVICGIQQQGLLLSADPFNLFFSLTHNFMCYCHFRRIRICVEECPLDSAFLSVRLSSRMRQRCSHWTIFHEIWYLRLYGNMPKSSRFGYNRTKVSVIIPEDQSTFVLLTAMRDVLYLYSSVRKTPFMRFHGNSQRFYIVDSYQQVNNNIKGKHNCIFHSSSVYASAPFSTLYSDTSANEVNSFRNHIR